MRCPSCQSENDDAAEVCFHCRAVLSAVTRGTFIANRYRILAPLGRGGMGAVYAPATRSSTRRSRSRSSAPEVAGTPEMAARFRSEIKLARKVSHWNVCRIHEYGEDAGLQYISMELISGATLKDRLRSGPLPVDQAFDVATQIAEGLAAIHKVGIIHRDLKSPNVMIDDEGTAKVMDFGIAKPASAGTDGASTGYVLGSPEYMSPEQARGRRADFRSDLYSLGIVVFEAFTGRVPFRGATPVETLMMHVEAPPPIDDPALALPPALLPVLRSALAKDPAARFADAASMAGALRAARGGAAKGVDASQTEVVHTRRLPVASRRPARAVVVAAVVVAALVAAALLARRGPEDTSLMSSSPPAGGRVARGDIAAALHVGDGGAGGDDAGSDRREPTGAVAGLSPARPAFADTRGPGRPRRHSFRRALTGGDALDTGGFRSPARSGRGPDRAFGSPATPAPPLEGWLLVLPKPWAEVTVDGRVRRADAAGADPAPSRIPLRHPHASGLPALHAEGGDPRRGDDDHPAGSGDGRRAALSNRARALRPRMR